MVSKRKKNHLKSPLLFLGVIFLGGWRGVFFWVFVYFGLHTLVDQGFRKGQSMTVDFRNTAERLI